LIAGRGSAMKDAKITISVMLSDQFERIPILGDMLVDYLGLSPIQPQESPSLEHLIPIFDGHSIVNLGFC
jgi:hypothetical protein